MAGDSPDLAFDAFIGRFRRAVQCVARNCGAFGSGHAVGQTDSVALTPQGCGAGDPAPLRAWDGRRDLFLDVAFHYTIAYLPADVDRGPYKVSTSYYSYRLLDRDSAEILAYQWHPEGVSDVRTPHLHVSCVRTLGLPLGEAGAGRRREIQFGSAHLPTGRVFLEDVVELLITAFDVQPQRDDWETILHDNREAIQRDRTW